MSTLTGLTGSGKTCLLSCLFGKDPPVLYTSTGLAEKSERGVFHYIGNMSFKLLSNKDILEFLAPLIQAGMTNVVSLVRDLLGIDATTAVHHPPCLLLVPSLSQCQRRAPLAKKWLGWFKKWMVLRTKMKIHMIDTGGQPSWKGCRALSTMPTLQCC